MDDSTRAPEVFAEALELLNLTDNSDPVRVRDALMRMIVKERRWNDRNSRLANF